MFESKSDFIKLTTFSNRQEAKKYVNQQLKTYALVFTEISKDAAIKKIVHEAVAERFDGDDNVLIKTLLEKCKKKGINIKEMFQSTLDKKNIRISVDELLTSLDGINEKNLYPQIYIPSFDNFSDASEEQSLGKKGGVAI